MNTFFGLWTGPGALVLIAYIGTAVVSFFVVLWFLGTRLGSVVWYPIELLRARNARIVDEREARQ